MRKTLHVLSCGIFQPELERIFTELKDDLADYEIAVDFIPPDYTSITINWARELPRA